MKVVRFAAGSLDLGYVYDDTEPSTKTPVGGRTRWVARTSDTASVSLELVRDDPEELQVATLDQESQTEGSEQPEQVDVGVQTDSAAKAFSALRKDLPQFSRPAKHFVK